MMAVETASGPAPKPNRRRRRRRVKRPPMRVYHGQDRLRMAYMAGEGKGSVEISDAIGGTTPGRVRSMLGELGIRLDQKLPGERIVKVKIAPGVLSIIEDTADLYGLDVGLLCAAILAAASPEADMMQAAVDSLLGSA